MNRNEGTNRKPSTLTTPFSGSECRDRLQLHSDHIRIMNRKLDDLRSQSNDPDFLLRTDQLRHQLIVQSGNLDEIIHIFSRNRQDLRALPDQSELRDIRKNACRIKEQSLLVAFERHFIPLIEQYNRICRSFATV